MGTSFSHYDEFINRHCGHTSDDLQTMLTAIGADSVEQLIQETVPDSIRMKTPLQLPAPMSEQEVLAHLTTVAQKNKVFKNYIGMGYYDTHTPTVILRNIMENPGWYTQYTPYQAEIAQGRLESLLNFQTMVIDLTKMEIAGASLLDEATAAAEAMQLMYSLRSKDLVQREAHTLFVSELCFPQTIEVLRTRCAPLGVTLRVGNHEDLLAHFDSSLFGVVLQYPDRIGNVHDYEQICTIAHEHGAMVTVAADLLALALLKPPGEFGADVCVGSAQRFGVPLGFGGPHAAFFATKEEFKRSLPGRIIGVSIDAQGNVALRMALQTREQHIKREKATSNICTAQALLANMAAMYAVYHGPHGIRAIANTTHALTSMLARGLQALHCTIRNTSWFDTLTIALDSASLQAMRQYAEEKEMNFRYDHDAVGISLDETTTQANVMEILDVFARALVSSSANGQALSAEALAGSATVAYPVELTRTSSYLTHPVFNTYHTEHEMLRYIKALENKDLSLTHSMIALGSCTMKLNATTEMIPVTWRAFNALHPFAPHDQTLGYQEIFRELEAWLSEITTFAACSLQPNAGAQGEYAGLMVIRAYHAHRGEAHRNVALIPSSAHGTNPASAVMAGMKVVVVTCDDNGNIDVDDLMLKAKQNAGNLACLMVTYPSTHGVFEERIIEICDLIHGYGGQVYMDGANMNAQVGLTSPGLIHADVNHFNLHKTFCIPHGGGGPGMGPICVAKHLQPFLPTHSVIPVYDNEQGTHISAVSAAPWGSASILLISYTYIRMMGGVGLTEATKQAILNANYMMARLQDHYPVLYRGKTGRVGHEFIIDLRKFKQTAGIETEDIAKRLMDYGFHAPTVSFPVAGTMMIEPTESEALSELDRFCSAMIAIRQEIAEIEAGTMDKTDNMLKNAPHTAYVVTADEWFHPYSRQRAVYPLAFVRERKFWPSIGRVNNTHGDRTLICACVPIDEYIEETVEA